MSREDEEITIQVLNVNLMMGDGLCAVDDDRDAVFMRRRNHLLDGIDGAQYIGNMCNGNHLRTFFQQFFILFLVQHTLVVHRHDKQLSMMPLNHLLPRHKVGVMFHRSDQHFVTLIN